MCQTEARATVIGYTQRGAIPTAYDSAFAFDAGRMAVDLLTSDSPELKNGFAIGVRDGRVYSTPLCTRWTTAARSSLTRSFIIWSTACNLRACSRKGERVGVSRASLPLFYTPHKFATAPRLW